MYSKLVLGLAMTTAGASAAELVRRDTAGGGGHGHDHGHAHAAPAAPSDGYGAPAPAASYGAPAPAASYGAPAPAASYGAPADGYGAPAASSGYAAPSTGYGYEATGYEEEGGFDLTAIIIPILILIGLSLLFPGIVNVSVRKRREAEEGANASPLGDVVERVNDIYMSVVESEECMQRIACEIGGIAEDVGLKENSLAKMGELFVPSKYKNYYKQFETGKNCHKIKCGNIF